MTALLEIPWRIREWLCGAFGHASPAIESSGDAWCSSCGRRL